MNLLQNKKWMLFVVLISCLGLFLLYSCDSSAGPDSDEKEQEQISVLLYVSGNQITTTYSAWPIPENDVASVDTTRIGFLMKLQTVPGEESSLRMYGLEGADVGKRENYLYPDCNNPDDCQVIGSLVDENLEVDITNNDRSYQAEGKIYQTYDPYIEMTGTYNYQNTTIRYEVEGGIMEE